MSQTEVVEVEATAQLKKFLDYPNQLYRGEPNYVAPLRSERLEFFDYAKNPFFRGAKVKLFLALADGRIKGRIATCVNYTHNEYHCEQTGFFGFFDCEDDYEVASRLLKVAMITLKKEGMERMRGPASFSTNHEIGFLIEGFDWPPTVMMTYNKPYLPRLAEKFGLKKAMDFVGYRLTKEDPIPERIDRVVTKMQQRSKIRLRSLRLPEFNEEIKRVNEIYNQAWAPNWGFVPMDKDEFFYTARNLRQIIDPDLVFIAEFEDRPVAFVLAPPDINQALIHLKGRLFPLGLAKLLWHTKVRNKVDGVRMITMGVIPQFQKRGVDSMMYINVYKKAVEKGYTWAELSWILETNSLMRRAAEEMGAHLYKRYRMVEMPI